MHSTSVAVVVLGPGGGGRRGRARHFFVSKYVEYYFVGEGYGRFSPMFAG
jgi:hypothetical protein